MYKKTIFRGISILSRYPIMHCVYSAIYYFSRTYKNKNKKKKKMRVCHNTS